MANWIESLDEQISALLYDWTSLTTFLAVLIVLLVVYPIVFAEEPDTHPLLLARQSTSSPVRNKYESAVYRSPETPHGYPLKSGLNIKDPGAPRWSMGRDGDLRDIWREVQRGGSVGPDGKVAPAGKIMTVLGRDEMVEHKVGDLSKEIQIIGKHMKEKGCTRVAIYLPNSPEFLLAIFACSFYGMSPVLLPYNLPAPKAYELLKTTASDGLVCAAGSLPLDDLAEECRQLKLLTWVVEKTSRHMDWNGIPDSAAGRLDVSVWHDVVEEDQAQASADLPTNDNGDPPAQLVSVWQPKNPATEPHIVSFTQSNLASAVAALISAFPPRQRFTPDDLVLPVSPWSINYVLCQTLAALFLHANLAINSVAEAGVDLHLATRGVSPTVIIASAETLANLHANETKAQVSIPQRLDKALQTRSLAAGRLPTATTTGVFRLLAPASSAAGNTPGKLRLLLTSERLGHGSPPLSSSVLSDLRIFTRARVCYALTAAQVAGAIAQTNVFDYRRDDDDAAAHKRHAHFGVPLASVEVKFVNTDDLKLEGAMPEGEMVVAGPAVSGDKDVRLGVQGKVRRDGTVAFA